MNLSEAKSALKRYGFDDSDPLQLWLDAALSDLLSSQDWQFLMGEFTVTVSSGANTMTLPSDFLKMVSLRDTTNNLKLERWDARKFDREISNQAEVGKAEVYRLIGLNQILLWRTLDSAVSFRGIYEKQFAGVSDDNLDLIPTPFHYPVVLRAASLGLMAENEEERAQTAQNEYISMLGSAAMSYQNQALDTPEVVQDTQGYNSEIW